MLSIFPHPKFQVFPKAVTGPEDHHLQVAKSYLNCVCLLLEKQIFKLAENWTERTSRQNPHGFSVSLQLKECRSVWKPLGHEQWKAQSKRLFQTCSYNQERKINILDIPVSPKFFWDSCQNSHSQWLCLKWVLCPTTSSFPTSLWSGNTTHEEFSDPLLTAQALCLSIMLTSSQNKKSIYKLQGKVLSMIEKKKKVSLC